MTHTPGRSSSASRNAQKPRGSRTLAAGEDLSGDFHQEVKDAMAAVLADLTKGESRIKSWNDAKLREQTKGLVIANVQATEAARIARRQLLTRDQVAERDATRDEIILGRLHELSDFAASLVPLDQQAAVKKQAMEFLGELRERIAADLAAVK